MYLYKKKTQVAVLILKNEVQSKMFNVLHLFIIIE